MSDRSVHAEWPERETTYRFFFFAVSTSPFFGTYSVPAAASSRALRLGMMTVESSGSPPSESASRSSPSSATARDEAEVRVERRPRAAICVARFVFAVSRGVAEALPFVVVTLG